MAPRGMAGQVEFMRAQPQGAEWIEEEGNFVVKLFPAGTPREAAEREADKTRLVRQYGMEVPLVREVVERGGRWGIRFDKAFGPTFTQWALQHPDSMIRLMAFFTYEHHEIHMHKVPELPSLKEILAERIENSDRDLEAKSAALKKLDRMRDGDWVLHWNYTPEDIIITKDGPIMFNWGEAMRGDFMADVARTSLLLERWEPRPEEKEQVERIQGRMYHDYIIEYMKISGRMDDELEAWKELLAYY